MTAVATKKSKVKVKQPKIFDYLKSCHFDKDSNRYMDCHVFDNQTEADTFGNIMRIEMAAYDTISVEIGYKTVRIYLYS